MRPSLTLPAPGSTAPPTARRSYVPALDGIRGIAIIGVLLFHTGSFAGGFLGVDLFFALSGYLITDLLLRETAINGRISLLGFWARRTRRLLPALAAMLCVVAAAVWMIGDADLVRSTRSDGPWVAANLTNWRMIAEAAGYWNRFGADRVFEHLWSVSVEEQFYLVWPLIVLLVAWRGVRVQGRVAAIALVGAGVSLALMIAFVDPADPTRAYMGSDTRAFSILLGAAAATGPVRSVLRRVTGLWRDGISVALILVLAAIWVMADGTRSTWLFTGGLFLHSALSAGLIGLIANGSGGPVASLLGWRPLRWVGRISYGLYLWHWPVIVLLTTLNTGLTGWLMTATVVGIATVLAALSHRFVENPVRFHAGWARGRTGTVLCVLTAAVLVFGWALLPEPPATMIDVDVL
ncbi:acyltransferase family protein [Diaminobutyricibacter sp. McL0608]|uniref:acyltransferase family protein n=1 Tax=Leifsonia sp. McL0608 TaxID=3143537 RepID=UPI0031F2FBE9